MCFRLFHCYSEGQYRGADPITTATLARRINRRRAVERPRHPATLADWQLSSDHVPDIFKTWDVSAAGRRHIIFVTAQQLDLLKNDTFKVCSNCFLLTKFEISSLKLRDIMLDF